MCKTMTVLFHIIEYSQMIVYRFAFRHWYATCSCCCVTIWVAQENDTDCDDCTIHSEAWTGVCVDNVNNCLTVRHGVILDNTVLKGQFVFIIYYGVSVRWHKWNCSQWVLWIIWSNQVVIFWKDSLSYSNVFVVVFEQHQRRAIWFQYIWEKAEISTADIPKLNNSKQNFLQRINSTRGKREKYVVVFLLFGCELSI